MADYQGRTFSLTLYDENGNDIYTWDIEDGCDPPSYGDIEERVLMWCADNPIDDDDDEDDEEDEDRLKNETDEIDRG